MRGAIETKKTFARMSIPPEVINLIQHDQTFWPYGKRRGGGGALELSTDDLVGVVNSCKLNPTFVSILRFVSP